MKWLFFSYSLPPKPSKARVYVWRQLKKIGAVNYQSVWVIPFLKKLLPDLENLAKKIESSGGASLTIEGKLVNPAEEERITKAILEAGTEEYQEVIEKCHDFLKEIESEIARKNFIFAEIEENDEDLDKLKKWLAKVESRHLLENPLRKEAHSKLKACEKALEDFSVLVFNHLQGKSPPQHNKS